MVEDLQIIIKHRVYSRLFCCELKSFKEELQAYGVPAGLIRISCGLEDIDDLIEDMEQALSKI